LRSPAIEAGHFGGGGGLIDEDKLFRIKDGACPQLRRMIAETS
jgi:hypothetical protein